MSLSAGTKSSSISTRTPFSFALCFLSRLVTIRLGVSGVIGVKGMYGLYGVWGTALRGSLGLSKLSRRSTMVVFVDGALCGGLNARKGKEDVLLPERRLRGAGAGARDELADGADSAGFGATGGGPGE